MSNFEIIISSSRVRFLCGRKKTARQHEDNLQVESIHSLNTKELLFLLLKRSEQNVSSSPVSVVVLLHIS
jgi:hypothetical protein